MAKKPKEPKERKKHNYKNAFNGVGMLFVVASIGFMSGIIYLGTDDYISKLLTVPAVIFAALELVKKFTK